MCERHPVSRCLSIYLSPLALLSLSLFIPGCVRAMRVDWLSPYDIYWRKLTFQSGAEAWTLPPGVVNPQRIDGCGNSGQSFSPFLWGIQACRRKKRQGEEQVPPPPPPPPPPPMRAKLLCSCLELRLEAVVAQPSRNHQGEESHGAKPTNRRDRLAGGLLEKASALFFLLLLLFERTREAVARIQLRIGRGGGELVVGGEW